MMYLKCSIIVEVFLRSLKGEGKDKEKGVREREKWKFDGGFR